MSIRRRKPGGASDADSASAGRRGSSGKGLRYHTDDSAGLKRNKEKEEEKPIPVSLIFGDHSESSSNKKNLRRRHRTRSGTIRERERERERDIRDKQITKLIQHFVKEKVKVKGKLHAIHNGIITNSFRTFKNMMLIYSTVRQLNRKFTLSKNRCNELLFSIVLMANHLEITTTYEKELDAIRTYFSTISAKELLIIHSRKYLTLDDLCAFKNLFVYLSLKFGGHHIIFF